MAVFPQTTSFKAFVQKSVTKFSLGDVNEKRPKSGVVLLSNWELNGKELLKAGENSKSLAVVSMFPVEYLCMISAGQCLYECLFI